MLTQHVCESFTRQWFKENVNRVVLNIKHSRQRSLETSGKRKREEISEVCRLFIVASFGFGSNIHLQIKSVYHVIFDITSQHPHAKHLHDADVGSFNNQHVIFDITPRNLHAKYLHDADVGSYNNQHAIFNIAMRKMQTKTKSVSLKCYCVWNQLP